MGPVFIRNGSPPSNARMGSPTSPLWVCVGFPPLFSWMISSKSAASPLAETPFWWAAGWTPFTTGADGLRTAAPGLCRFPAAAERKKLNSILFRLFIRQIDCVRDVTLTSAELCVLPVDLWRSFDVLLRLENKKQKHICFFPEKKERMFIFFQLVWKESHKPYLPHHSSGSSSWSPRGAVGIRQGGHIVSCWCFSQTRGNADECLNCTHPLPLQTLLLLFLEVLLPLQALTLGLLAGFGVGLLFLEQENNHMKMVLFLSSFCPRLVHSWQELIQTTSLLSVEKIPRLPSKNSWNKSCCIGTIFMNLVKCFLWLILNYLCLLVDSALNVIHWVVSFLVKRVSLSWHCRCPLNTPFHNLDLIYKRRRH